MSPIALQALFGAALAPFCTDGVLHTTTTTDDGIGGFTVATVDLPIKVMVESLSEKDRVASGLPADAVTLIVLRAGLAATIAVDDGVSVGAATYRVLSVGTDAGQTRFSLQGVPA